MNEQQHSRYYSTRPRRVPPEFCSDEFLEECSILATLLLYRIVSQADDQGRLPGHPRYIKAVCFPMRPEVTERKVAGAIDELARAGFLIRYDARQRVYLQIDRWQDLQGRWGRRAYRSRYPAPPGWTQDWVSVKDPEPEPELRAPGAHGARDLRPPIPFAPPSSITPSFAGLGKPPASAGGPEHIRDVIERAKRGRLTDQDAFELGSSLVDADQSARSVP
jgi:hypothetical protein